MLADMTFWNGFFAGWVAASLAIKLVVWWLQRN
jgi:hypothetical protein